MMRTRNTKTIHVTKSKIWVLSPPLVVSVLILIHIQYTYKVCTDSKSIYNTHTLCGILLHLNYTGPSSAAGFSSSSTAADQQEGASVKPADQQEGASVKLLDFLLSCRQMLQKSCGHQHGASKKGFQMLSELARHKKEPRNPSDFVISPDQVPAGQSVFQRDKNIAAVFKSQSELDFYMFHQSSRMSNFEGNQLLSLITKVKSVYTVHVPAYTVHVQDTYLTVIFSAWIQE
jgi:hypothetical protein